MTPTQKAWALSCDAALHGGGAAVQDKEPDSHDPADLGDMLQELRVLLPGAQMLTAFLILLPFRSEDSRESQSVS